MDKREVRVMGEVKAGRSVSDSVFFFFNDTATTEIYTLSLHDALPISPTESNFSLNICPRKYKLCAHTKGTFSLGKRF